MFGSFELPATARESEFALVAVVLGLAAGFVLGYLLRPGRGPE